MQGHEASPKNCQIAGPNNSFSHSPTVFRAVVVRSDSQEVTSGAHVDQIPGSKVFA